ncbi:MAG: flagellar biosynthesis anti-sigma factor FlgM [Treponema sp.]|nr:flagellar biosynthesis anti-sigma factor FlgM [Treponema sp.]
MMINRIGSIDPIQSGKNIGLNGQANRKVQTDSISLSAEALEKSELYHANAVVASVSDVRMERIVELKQKINDPSYINDKIIQATADSIMDAFGL